MGSVRILCGSALQTYSAVGHCRDIWWLGTAGILGGWAVQGYSAVGHCRDTLRLDTAGILGGWSRTSASSRARTTSTLKSNNPTARVGKNSMFPKTCGNTAMAGTQETRVFAEVSQPRRAELCKRSEFA